MLELIKSELEKILEASDKPISTLDLIYVLAARTNWTASVGLAIDCMRVLRQMQNEGTVLESVAAQAPGREVSYWSAK